jgi:hypothetical protein
MAFSCALRTEERFLELEQRCELVDVDGVVAVQIAAREHVVQLAHVHRLERGREWFLSGAD